MPVHKKNINAKDVQPNDINTANALFMMRYGYNAADTNGEHMTQQLYRQPSSVHHQNSYQKYYGQPSATKPIQQLLQQQQPQSDPQFKVPLPRSAYPVLQPQYRPSNQVSVNRVAYNNAQQTNYFVRPNIPVNQTAKRRAKNDPRLNPAKRRFVQNNYNPVPPYIPRREEPLNLTKSRKYVFPNNTGQMSYPPFEHDYSRELFHRRMFFLPNSPDSGHHSPGTIPHLHPPYVNPWKVREGVKSLNVFARNEHNRLKREAFHYKCVFLRKYVSDKTFQYGYNPNKSRIRRIYGDTDDELVRMRNNIASKRSRIKKKITIATTKYEIIFNKRLSRKYVSFEIFMYNAIRDLEKLCLTNGCDPEYLYQLRTQSGYY